MNSIRKLSIALLLLFTVANSSYSQLNHKNYEELQASIAEAKKKMLTGDFETSLRLAKENLKQAIQLKDNYLIAVSYNTIAGNFDGLTEPEKAFSYYKKALYFSSKTNNNILKYQINNNLGNIYFFNKKQFVKGITYYKKSLEYGKKVGDTAKLVFTHSNLAWAYFDIEKFNQGYTHLQFINQYHPQYCKTESTVLLNMLNGIYYNHTEENKKSISYFEKAIKEGEIIENESDLPYAYLEYSKLLFKIKQFEKAYQNLKLHQDLNEKILNDDKVRKANIIGINLQLDEYKRNVDRISFQYKTKNTLLNEEQLKNKKIIIAVIVIIIMLLILFYYISKNKQLIQENKIKSIESKINEKMINATINGQELERKKTSIYLHDSISAFLSTAGMHLSVYKQLTKTESQEIRKAKEIIDDVHDKVRNLSHELHPSLLNRFGLYFGIEDLCEKNSNSTIEFKYIGKMATSTHFNSDFEMKIYFIVTELLNNIIKHSAATTAKVVLNEKNNLLTLEVIDNGRGFYKKYNTFTQGFGLNQIQSRIHNMNGTILIDSKVNSGTKIVLEIPIEFKQ